MADNNKKPIFENVSEKFGSAREGAEKADKEIANRAQELSGRLAKEVGVKTEEIKKDIVEQGFQSRSLKDLKNSNMKTLVWVGVSVAVVICSLFGRFIVKKRG